MSQNIEESSTLNLGVYINQNAAKTLQHSPIHQASSRVRPSTSATLKKTSTHLRQDSHLQNQATAALPLVVHKLRISESHRLCRSEAAQHSKVDEPLIRRIQLCELMANKQRPITRYSCKKQSVTSKDTVFKCNTAYFAPNKSNKKQNKKGYESQQHRLRTTKQYLKKLYSRYDRVNGPMKLSDVVAPLREQIIRNKKSKLL